MYTNVTDVCCVQCIVLQEAVRESTILCVCMNVLCVCVCIHEF